MKITKEVISQKLINAEVDLNTTHKKLSIPIINRIYKKMIANIKFDDIKVCGKLIIDGHHRYVSSILAEKPINRVNSAKTSATVKYNWDEVDFVNEEWDTKHKILQLNKLDAEFNNISLDAISELIK